jgi:hypothetical protein
MATYPLTSLPALSSLPGAAKTIYLNFTGDFVASWDNGTYTNITIPPFDMDGDTTTFSDTELADITTIWNYVAERFAPFNINVTTVPPASFDPGVTQKHDFGGDGSWYIPTIKEGGSEVVGGFTQPGNNITFTFPPNIDTYAPDIAFIACHSLGHAFGLVHQSVWNADGTKAYEYNPGPDGVTAPVMGTDFAYWPRALARWWYGTSDLSPTSIQDDMAIIAGTSPPLYVGSPTGIGYRPAPSNMTAATAAPLAVSGASVSGSGIIRLPTDQDYFSFTTGAGPVSLSALVQTDINTLVPRLELRDATGSTLIASAGPDANCDATITTTLPAGSYRLMVADSDGQYGNVGQYTVSGTIVPPTSSVNPPTSLAATAVSTSQVNLTWTDNATNETGYAVERSTDGVTWSALATGLPAGSTSYADAAASPGTTYNYLVYAYNSSSTSANSNQATATTVTVAPSGLTATAVSSSQVGLSWRDVAGETGFQIERSLDGSTWGIVGTTGAGVTSYQDTSVSASTTYQYRAKASDAGGLSACSNVASTTTPTATTPPAAPTNLTATAVSTSQVNLNWQDNSSNESGFFIERSSTSGRSWTQIAQVATNVTSYTDASVSRNKSYSYRVRAYNASGNSAYSNVASVATPKAPSIVVAAGPLPQASSAYETVVPIGSTRPGPAHRQAGTVAKMVHGSKSSPAIASRFDLVDWTLADWPRHHRVLGQSLKRTT